MIKNEMMFGAQRKIWQYYQYDIWWDVVLVKVG